MFENYSESQARNEILSFVDEYCKTFHNQKKVNILRVIGFHMRQGYMTVKRCVI